MKKRALIILIFLSLFIAEAAFSQCSICSRTAEQMGEKPAKALNAGIIYLAFAPLAIAFYVGFRWWKNNKENF